MSNHQSFFGKTTLNYKKKFLYGRTLTKRPNLKQTEAYLQLPV